MKDAKDPDEFIQKFGSVAFQHILDNSDGAINFEINKCKNGLDLDSDLGKIEFLKRVFKVLASVTSPIEREYYISKVASENNVAKGVVEQEISAIIKKSERSNKKREWNKTLNFNNKPKDKLNPNESLRPREVKAEKGILSYIFLNPNHAEKIRSSLSAEHFISDINRKIYINLVDKIINAEDYSISSFHDEFSSEEMGKISEIIALSKNHFETWETISDYIKLLNSQDIISSTSNSGAEISDEDLLAIQNRLRKTKK
ncbi:MAG: hypothetical protein GX896_09495, partial [Clostridiales bacterium]|nr:hypothetical protein [Clostridiales bacterium]